MKDKISINCHSSIRIASEQIIYFDPYDIKEKRNDADIIFMTHDHYDHFDMESINNIRKEETLFIVPDSMGVKILEKGIDPSYMVTVLPNNNYNICDIDIEVIPSYNINKDFHPKNNGWVGYIITLNNERIYVAGDTDMTFENEKVLCDIALIPIGGTYTMDYKEASTLINKIKPKVVIPTHYGKIVGNLEDGIRFKERIDEKIECILLI